MIDLSVHVENFRLCKYELLPYGFDVFFSLKTIFIFLKCKDNNIIKSYITARVGNPYSEKCFASNYMRL